LASSFFNLCSIIFQAHEIPLASKRKKNKLLIFTVGNLIWVL